MENKKWTDADLRTAFEDSCKFINFKDLQDFLLERRKNSDTSESNCNILVSGSSSRHPKCKGWKKYDWGMMDGPEYGCDYNTTIECDECKYCIGSGGRKDPEAKCNQQK